MGLNRVNPENLFYLKHVRLNPELKSQSKHVLNKTSLEKDFTQDMGLIFASTELLKS